jgi:hypothetical protein
MRSYILFLALAALSFGSCTTAYKTGQTVDDVYYSPTRPQDEYVVAQQQDDRYYGSSSDYYTDRYLRMRATNPYRWSALDDYYFNNPFAYNYYGSYNNWYSPWNGYWGWNSYYNPYYVSPIFIKNPGNFRTVPSRATVFNPRSYLNTTPMNVAGSKSGNMMNGAPRGTNMSYYNPRTNNGGGNTRYNNSNSRNYNNNSNSNSNSGRSNSYSQPSNSTPTRSYTPSSSSSNSSSRGSSSSGSTAPTRPPR